MRKLRCSFVAYSPWGAGRCDKIRWHLTKHSIVIGDFTGPVGCGGMTLYESDRKVR